MEVIRIGLVAAVTLGALAPAARADTDHQLQMWDSVSITGDLSPAKDGFALWFDGHLRRADAGSTVIVRPGVGYRLSSTWSVWAGYAWVPFFTEGGDRKDEHRGWQQVLGSFKFGSLALAVRGRFEERRSDGDDTGLRVRAHVRAMWTPPGSSLGLVAWDEAFIALNDTDWKQVAGFDQNRTFIGVSAPVGGGARIEGGYLFAYVDRAVNVQIHSLLVALTLPLSR